MHMCMYMHMYMHMHMHIYSADVGVLHRPGFTLRDRTLAFSLASLEHHGCDRVPSRDLCVLPERYNADE